MAKPGSEMSEGLRESVSRLAELTRGEAAMIAFWHEMYGGPEGCCCDACRDPDEGHEIREEVVERLKASRERPRLELLTLGEVRREIDEEVSDASEV